MVLRVLKSLLQVFLEFLNLLFAVLCYPAIVLFVDLVLHRLLGFVFIIDGLAFLLIILLSYFLRGNAMPGHSYSLRPHEVLLQLLNMVFPTLLYVLLLENEVSSSFREILDFLIDCVLSPQLIVVALHLSSYKVIIVIPLSVSI